MSSIAFIGLGIMGSPMAKHLVEAGHNVIGYNRSAAKRQALVAVGGRAATSLGEALAGADVVITMLPDSPDVEAVFFGEGADGASVLSALRPGGLYIDASTIRPAVSRRIAESADAAGFLSIDAPVSGGEAGAIEAKLSIMVGGTDEAFTAAKPLLDLLGTTVVHVGPAGSGQTVKAANQLIVATNIQALAEAIVFLEAQNVDTEKAIEVLAGGLAGSTVINRKAAGMLARTFTPGFRVELHHKDLGIVRDAARESGVSLPVATLVSELMAALKAQGNGGLDHSALLLLVENLSGRAETPAPAFSGKAE